VLLPAGAGAVEFWAVAAAAVLPVLAVLLGAFWPVGGFPVVAAAVLVLLGAPGFVGMFAAAVAFVPARLTALAAVVVVLVLVPVLTVPGSSGGGGPTVAPPVMVPVGATGMPAARFPPGWVVFVLGTDAMVLNRS